MVHQRSNLTPSKEFANFLLSKDDLQRIVPLNGTYINGRYPNGEWVSMHWSSLTMKIAARHLPSLSGKTTVEEINAAIDKHYESLSDQEQKSLTLVELEKVLVAALDIDVTTVSNGLDGYYNPTCGCRIF